MVYSSGSHELIYREDLCYRILTLQDTLRRVYNIFMLLDDAIVIAVQ
jgi:hypothetical protein